MKTRIFHIKYAGDNPPKLDDIRSALVNGNIDSCGVIEIIEDGEKFEE